MEHSSLNLKPLLLQSRKAAPQLPKHQKDLKQETALKAILRLPVKKTARSPSSTWTNTAKLNKKMCERLLKFMWHFRHLICLGLYLTPPLINVLTFYSQLGRHLLKLYRNYHHYCDNVTVKVRQVRCRALYYAQVL